MIIFFLILSVYLKYKGRLLVSEIESLLVKLYPNFLEIFAATFGVVNFKGKLFFTNFGVYFYDEELGGSISNFRFWGLVKEKFFKGSSS